MHIKTQLNVFPYFKLKQKTSKGGYICIWVETQKVLHIINKYHFHSNKHFITLNLTKNAAPNYISNENIYFENGKP